MKNTQLYTPRDLQAFQARFALRIAANLTEQAESAPQDISERLRFAREQALERARLARRGLVPQAVPAVQTLTGGVTALLSGGHSPWWLKLVSLVPLAVLLIGLSAIEDLHDRSQIAAAAEIDAALLSDGLPPDAYRDPGFLEFLKTSQE